MSNVNTNEYNFDSFIFPEFESINFENEIQNYQINKDQIFKLKKGINRNFWKSEREMIFDKKADFSHSIFLDNAEFNHITFQSDVYFQGSTFKDRTHFVSSIFKNGVYLGFSIFKNDILLFETTFEHKVSFDSSTFQNEFVLLDSIIQDEISFSQSIFQGKVLFRDSLKTKHTQNILYFYYTKFMEGSSLDFRDCDIKSLIISDIRNYSDFVKFTNIRILKKFVLIDTNLTKIEFHNMNLTKCRIEIENVSFIGNSGFTIFNNIKWGNVNRINGNRDTFRQLKYVNEKQGNVIEANRFYSAEMREYKKELKDIENEHKWQDKFIFYLNEKTSNFSQSWILPLGWFLTIGLFFYVLSNINNIRLFEFIVVSIFSLSLVLYYHFIFLIEDCKCKANKLFWSSFITSILTFIYFFNLSSDIDDFLEFINPIPFSNSINDYPPFIWIIFKALSAFIIYQFIVSLRRQTRR